MVLIYQLLNAETCRIPENTLLFKIPAFKYGAF